MKTALLALITSLVLALSASVLQAQPGSGQGGGPGAGGGGGMRMNPEARVQQLIATLEVTPEQEPAFREAMARVNELQMAAMEGMRQGGGQGQGGGPGAGLWQGMQRRAQMQRQMKELLAPVLTEAQMTKFREAEEARMSQMRERNAP
jgi:hypothetical protein